ncbi:type VI secretion system domain-containing protein [Pasteurella atlantica]|uniref:Type VI secretion system domain-containing protein n=2 Tax=Pasteurellaceae TaxID=712 RepID=A0ACC6HPT7_9PAST|nr:type VI secretion system domain-containing protein [Pasteurella atlantica]MDP8052631.1 type VI secretion system domain-containing protein [Pasteurella atlantica]MDP8105769.1 type VI secretion system domain-containing protein [Pasteurella atlantica]MDP8149289.1 type VI secretion system domain-containing protein [Pasteurella atlantica]
MNIKDIIKPILGDDSPIGKPNNQSEFLYDADREIMKIGSLQHGEVDWEIINKQSVKYLTDICKDYKVVSFLLRYVLHTKDTTKIIDFLDLLTTFNKQYIFSAYPTPNLSNEIKGSKAKVLKMIISYLDNFIKNELVECEDIKFLDSFLLFFTALQSHLSTNKSLSTYIESINKSLSVKKNNIPQVVNDKDDPVFSNITKKDTELGKEIQSPMLVPNELSLDSIRNVKSSYLKLAGHNNSTSPSDPLGYQLRRYAMWHSVTAVPLKNKAGITEMTAVASDRVADYQSALKRFSDINLLKKIEKTLETSPFWIDGNYLAAQCAENLGYNDVSREIKEQTAKFVAKFPEFYDMKFMNGSSFISDETTRWLSEKDPVESLNTISYNSTEFQECYEKHGLLEVLAKIDTQYKKVTDIREKFNLRLEKISYLIKENVQGISIVELKELKKIAKDYSVIEWESSFFQTIDATLSQLEKQL